MSYTFVVNGLPIDLREAKILRMNEFPCQWAPHDPAACKILFTRLRDAAARRTFLTYAEFVKGVAFHLPDGKGGLTLHAIDTSFLRARDEAIINDFARYLGAATYRDCGVLLNTLLVPNGHPHRLPTAFLTWANDVGLGPGKNAANHYALYEGYWTTQLQAVYRYFAQPET